MTNGQELTELLKARKYNPAHKPKAESVVWTINGKVCGTLENYCIISGLPKASKSTYAAACLASALVPAFSSVFGIKINLPKERSRIAYFDTESSQWDFYRQMERVRNFADKQTLPETLDAFSMREDMPGRIRKLIEQYLSDNTDCSCIIVDGFLDLCLNYNDETETRLLTNWFKRITKEYNILMIGVLHLGKGHGETLGHLGSNTDRWAQSTLIVEKNKETKQFVLKPKYLRSSEDFEPIAIMNFDGQWNQVPYIEPEPILPTKKPKK
jgi:hypothetical protein